MTEYRGQNYQNWPDLLKICYLKVFEIAEYKSDIKNTMFKIADPIWRIYITNKIFEIACIRLQLLLGNNCLKLFGTILDLHFENCIFDIEFMISDLKNLQIASFKQIRSILIILFAILDLPFWIFYIGFILSDFKNFSSKNFTKLYLTVKNVPQID